MNKKIVIRKASLEDAEELFHIEQACFGEAEATVRESFEQIVGYDHYFLYVLIFEGELGGFFCAIQDKDEAHLADLALKPELQGKGLGSLLLDQCFKKLREKNCRRLVLTVRKNNHSALKLYRKKGFRELELISSYYGDEDGLRLQYEL